MPYIIDAHLDLAYNALTFGRNYLRSAVETRRMEQDGPTPERTGHTLLGWPEFQRGQVALVFATLFAAPRRYGGRSWETQVFADSEQAYRIYQNQLNYYRRLCDEHPDQFRLVLNQQDLRAVLEPWEQEPAYLPPPPHPENAMEEADRPAGSGEQHSVGNAEHGSVVTHPVGLVLLMEGLEGIRAPEEMEEWWEHGVRLAGPVWAGTRFCGGTYEPGGFTAEGYALLEVMGELGFGLDLSHMTEDSTLQALDRYEGPILATHANVRSLLRGVEGERLFTERTINRLIERDGCMGVVPYNRFLKTTWTASSDRKEVTLQTLAAHIDHICQIAGDAFHAGIGSDFDGGFGWPSVPLEINTVADLQLLAPVLTERGYDAESIACIFGKNWRQQLERILPAS
jgi:membrane dipeptidase